MGAVVSPRPKILSLASLQGVLCGLPPDRKVIVFFIHRIYHNQHVWMDALAAECRVKGFVTVGLLTWNSAPRCSFQAVDYLAEVDQDGLLQLDRIDLFLISDMDAGIAFPRNSRLLGCLHTLYCDPGNVFMAPFTRYLPMLDGWLIPGRLNDQSMEAIPKLWTGLLDKDLSLRKNPAFHLIPVPYPRLAMMLPQLSAAATERDSFIYAPVWADHGAGCIEKYGEELISVLLTAFPERNVIFRPSYQDIDRPEVRRITELFQNESRFILDTDVEQVKTFARGIALITDFSNVAKSFSFTTLQPSIQFQPWHNREDVIDVSSGSYKVYDYRAMMKLLQDVEANQELYRQKVKAMRESLIISPEEGLQAMASILDNYATGKAEPGWLAIDRFAPGKPDDVDIIWRLEKEVRCRDIHASAAAAMFSRRTSPLLAAYALHMGKILLPDNTRLYGVGDGWERLVGPLPETYGEIPPEAVLRLYAHALEEKQKKNDLRGVEIVLALLRDFRQGAGL